MLAALDWNSQTRILKKAEDGSAKRHLVHSKRRKAWVPKRIYDRTTGNHIQSLMDRTIQVRMERLKLDPIQRPALPQNIAAVEKPDVEIPVYRTRFQCMT